MKTNGNIFLAIFGAVALVGVIGGGVMTFSKGPIQSALNLTRKNNADVEMGLASQTLIMGAANPVPVAANCSGLGASYYNDPSSGHCYFTTTNTNSWGGQRSACLANSAYLVNITSAGELNTVLTQLSLSTSASYYFTGSQDISTEGKWVYTDGPEAGVQFWQGDQTGSAVGGAYNFWESGYPNGGTSANCQTPWWIGRWAWVDRDCAQYRPGICEKSPALPGDCDGDGYVEPPEWRTGTNVPTGGGLIPNSAGVSKKDPWGNEYGYCAWDDGPVILNGSCRSGGADQRLRGTDSKKYPVVAIISAGPDGVFTTTCRSFTTADVNGDGNLEGATDLPLVSKAASTDDDLIVTYSYNDAMSTSGGLWRLKSTDTNTAYVDKKVEAQGANVTGTGTFERIAAIGGDFVDVISGLKLADPLTMTACNLANTSILRRAVSGFGIEICNGSSWLSPSGSGASAINDLSDGIFKATGNLFAGMNAGNETLSGSNNTSFGISALSPLTTGTKNSAFGYEAMAAATTASNNTAIGWRAGKNITTGTFNTAIGYEALLSCASCTSNVAVGYQASKMQTGSYNTAVGARVLLSNTTGQYNSVIGTEGAKSMTAGDSNTLIGNQIGLYSTTLADNAAAGAGILELNSAASNNVLLGYHTLQSTTAGTANDNVIIGAGSFAAGNSASQNVALGQAIATSNVSNNNVFIGNSAGGNSSAGELTAVGNSSLGGTSGLRNTGFGYNTGSGITSGADNTMLGYIVMAYNSAASSNNTLAGFSAISSGATGSDNNTGAGHSVMSAGIGVKTDNTAIGYQALKAATAAANNTVYGYQALVASTTAGDNVAVGYQSLTAVTTGGTNTAFGSKSGAALTTQAGNTLGGAFAGQTLTGAPSVAVGANALANTATSSNDVAVGYTALLNGPGGNSTCIGASSCVSGGANNTALGYAALKGGTNNVAVGASAASSMTASNNVAVGIASLSTSVSGTKLTAFGARALSATTVSDNTGFGYYALNSTTTGSGNTAYGVDALRMNTTGANNTAYGYSALRAQTTGQTNTAYGLKALTALTSGNNNVAYGGTTATTQTDFTNVTLIGPGQTVTSGLSNVTAIGNGASVTASNKVRFGDSNITTISGQVSFTATSDARVKKDIRPTDLGLDFIMKLKPVSYRMIGGNGRLDYGFLAQDVEAALLPRKTNMVTRANDPMKTYHMRGDDLLAPIVKAVQEQQNELDQLSRELDSLQ